MGDRISISFAHDGRESVALYSHWRGKGLVDDASRYVQELRRCIHPAGGTPLDRLDPETVIVDFIRHLTRDLDRVTGDLYLGKDGGEGDNSDNGHRVIKL